MKKDLRRGRAGARRRRGPAGQAAEAPAGQPRERGRRPARLDQGRGRARKSSAWWPPPRRRPAASRTRPASWSTSRSRRPSCASAREVASAAVRIAEEMVRRSVKPDDEQPPAARPSSPISRAAPRAASAEPSSLMAAFGGSVARRYARALFDIGVDKGRYEALRQRARRAGRDLRRLARAAPDAGEPGVQAGPAPRPSSSKLLPRVAPSREVRSFALLLLERGRISAAAGHRPRLPASWSTRSSAGCGPRSPRPSRSTRPPQTAVQRALERRTGKKVVDRPARRSRPDRRHRRPGRRPGVRRQPAHPPRDAARAAS